MVQPEVVKNKAPTEAEVDLAVGGLKMGRAEGLSGMRAEELNRWRKESKWENETEGRRWELVVWLLKR